MPWWTRPVVRLIVALLLPFVVPAVLTLVLWVLPGDPSTILCGSACTEEAKADLIARWHLTSPVSFYSAWLGNAVTGDFGRSVTAFQGELVSTLLWNSLPQTATLIALSLVPIVVSTVLVAMGWLPRRLDAVWQVVGLAPAVILALFAVAWIVVTYGPNSDTGWPGLLRLILGGLVLGIADNALSGAVVGTRSVFEREMQQRYAQMSILRGESMVANTLPNVLPALAGQLRGRVLHLLSGAVVVEVVLAISGIGDLLWRATLSQDFFVVLAAAWGFALFSAALLGFQGLTEIAVAWYVRRSPSLQAVVA